MNVVDAILKRRSVRSYKDEEVSEETLQKVLNAARMAPSASNRQEWKFVVVRDKEVREDICEATRGQGHVKEAPVVVAGVNTDPGYEMTCGISGGTVDLAIALDHLSLKATEEGLGTCWVGAFYQDEVRRVLGIPEGYEVVSMMTLGHPKYPLRKESKERKSLEEVVSYDEYPD